MKYLMLTATLAALVAVPVAAAPAKTTSEKTIVTKEIVKSDADAPVEALVNDCSARKFETSATLEKDGQKRITKLKLCSNPGADDAAWLKTLESAKSKIADIPDISPESRAKIEAELSAEIEKLKVPAQ